MPPVLAAFIAASIAWQALDLYLNQRQSTHVARHRNAVPPDFTDQVTLAEHQKAASYTQARIRLSSLRGIVELALGILLAAWGIDALAGLSAHISAPWSDILLIALVSLTSVVVMLPFRLYGAFVLEHRFGFNKTTPATFIADTVKGLALSAIIGLPLLLALFWAMDHLSHLWWLYAWAALVVIMFAAPAVYIRLVAPLFNTFSPLADDTLRTRIETLMRRCGFQSSGLFTMDASRRSTHGNAYFIGFGRAKRIVLFDTLLASQTEDEVEAVLAHELGHFKFRHTLFSMARSALITFVVLAAIGWLYRQPWLLTGFGFTHTNAAIGLIAAQYLIGIFTPALTPLSNWISRRHEFQADGFARQMVGAAPMISALTKLSRDNAGTLTPDPLYALVNYSHPPVPVRVAHLREAG